MFRLKSLFTFRFFHYIRKLPAKITELGTSTFGKLSKIFTEMTANGFNQVSQMLERLRCEICENYVKVGKNRWYSCVAETANHKICQDCVEVDKHRKCYWNCGKSIKSMYCAITEELLRSGYMKFTCSNYDSGCREIGGEDCMNFHETECVYRSN